MQYQTTSANPVRRRSACAIVGVFKDGKFGAAAAAFDDASRGALTRLVKDGEVTGAAGEAHLIPAPEGIAAARVLVVGCGPRDRFDDKAYRAAVSAAVARLSRTRLKDAMWTLSADGVDGVDPYYLGRQSAETAAAAVYRFDEQKGKTAGPKVRLETITAIADTRASANRLLEGLRDGDGVAAGIRFTRDLANRSPNVCHPTHMAQEARRLAARHKRLEVEILSAAQMKKLGMGALLSVAQGSEQPPRLIVLRYRGAAASQAPVVLVGKAITFDTGGISLKPPPNMDEMKFDMGGGGAVLGTLAAIAELGPKTNVIGVVPACENMPSGRATRPGDIVTSMSGQTIEVLNTDAEGRMILCDALTYSRRFKPAAIVDVATLTGACVIALGNQYTAVFSHSDDLARSLLEAGDRVGDPAWRMPVNDEYGESLKSNFADFANVGAREGGSSVAAAFLSRFTEGLNWAHLDIAGSAWKGGREKGSTGRPVSLLTEFVLSRC